MVIVALPELEDSWCNIDVYIESKRLEFPGLKGGIHQFYTCNLEPVPSRPSRRSILLIAIALSPKQQPKALRSLVRITQCSALENKSVTIWVLFITFH